MKKIYQFFQKRVLFAYPRDRYFLIGAFGVFVGLMPQNLSAKVSTATTASVHELAQGVTIRGKVTDETGASLPGVNILEKGTTNGTVSDTEGSYTLSVASTESVLVFSFIGTVTQEVRVGSQSEIAIRLLNDAETLSEVVVIGYGTQEKKDITGAISSVQNEGLQ